VVRSPKLVGDGPYGRLVPTGADLGWCTGLGRSRWSPAVGRPQDARCGSAWPAVAVIWQPGGGVVVLRELWRSLKRGEVARGRPEGGAG
jgi:hypothetical protein